MKRYRLKKEAVPYFKEGLATQILDWDVWMNNNVDEKALEEVKPIYLTYGHTTLRPDQNSSSLGGWHDNKAEFHFTIHFPDIQYCEYDKFHNGKIIRDMMNRIQSYMDSYFSDFVNKTEKD